MQYNTGKLPLHTKNLSGTEVSIASHSYSTRSQSKSSKASKEFSIHIKIERNGSHYACTEIGVQRFIHQGSCSKKLFASTTKETWSQIVEEPYMLFYSDLYKNFEISQYDIFFLDFIALCYLLRSNFFCYFATLCYVRSS